MWKNVQKDRYAALHDIFTPIRPISSGGSVGRGVNEGRYSAFWNLRKKTPVGSVGSTHTAIHQLLVGIYWQCRSRFGKFHFLTPPSGTVVIVLYLADVKNQKIASKAPSKVVSGLSKIVYMPTAKPRASGQFFHSQLTTYFGAFDAKFWFWKSRKICQV